jgi:hypothetical protein
MPRIARQTLLDRFRAKIAAFRPSAKKPAAST